MRQVTKILYATEDDFVSPEDLEKENGGDELDAPAVDAAGGAVEAFAHHTVYRSPYLELSPG